MRRIPTVTANDIVSWIHYNRLATVANAFSLCMASGGLSISSSNGKTILSAIIPQGDTSEQENLIGTSSTTLLPVNLVNGGDNIIPDDFNAICDIANAFANIQAGSNISIAKADGAFLFSLTPSISRTDGTITNCSYITSPFISCDAYNAVAKILNAMLSSFGNNGILFKQADGAFELTLDETGKKTISDLNLEGADDTCKLPTYLGAIGLEARLIDYVACGGTWPNGEDQLQFSSEFPINGTPECDYYFDLDIEAKLTSNATFIVNTTEAFVLDFKFDPSGDFVKVLEGDSGGGGCGMVLKTTAYQVKIPGDQFLFLALSNKFTPNSPNVSDCYVKITGIRLVSSVHN